MMMGAWRSWKISLTAGGVLFVTLMALSAPAACQTWAWTTEEVDVAGTDTSIAADRDGNLHVGYRFAEGGELRYAFRPTGSSKWFKMTLDRGQGAFSTKIIVDSESNPHICYTPRGMKYARFDGRKWVIQEVDPGSGNVAFHCSIQVTREGRPIITWYLETGTFLRYATLQDGAWMARSVDGGGGDLPGKWNSMLLDAQGNPHIAYSAFPFGQLRYAFYDGKNWHRRILDSPTENPLGGVRGMGNSLGFDAKGNPMISYMDEESVKFARFTDGKWTDQTIERLPPFGVWSWRIMRSSLVLDRRGYPHISFQSLLGLHHAWWDGTQWHSQLVLAAHGNSYFDSAMSIDANDVLYISYTDPADGTLRVATGRLSQTQQTMKAGEEPKKTDRNPPEN